MYFHRPLKTQGALPHTRAATHLRQSLPSHHSTGVQRRVKRWVQRGGWTVGALTRWWQLKYILEFSPRTLGKMKPVWRAYFFKWAFNHQLDKGQINSNGWIKFTLPSREQTCFHLGKGRIIFGRGYVSSQEGTLYFGGPLFFLEIAYFTLDWFLSFTVTTLHLGPLNKFLVNFILVNKENVLNCQTPCSRFQFLFALYLGLILQPFCHCALVFGLQTSTHQLGGGNLGEKMNPFWRSHIVSQRSWLVETTNYTLGI